MPAIPQFLDAQAMRENAAEAGLDESCIQTLADLARRIADDRRLLHDAIALYKELFDTDGDVSELVRRIDHVFGPDADVLHALYVLASLGLTRERQAARGMPPTIAQAINHRFGGAWLRDAMARGNIGLTYWNTHWLRTAASGNLVRLGRLEFLPLAWEYPFHIYTHARTRTLIALATAGQRYTDEGILVGTTTWEATYSETDEAIIGTPITPEGLALPQRVRLPRCEWQRALSPGEPVLDIHVPAEGGLTIDALRDALMEAVPFFDHYYPDHRFVAYVCESWLFSPQLEAMLGPASNIIRWHYEGYLLPSNNGAEDFLAFTFGSPTIDTTTAPRDTRLRRAMIVHLEQGGTLSWGRFLLLREDLERFGSQPYRQASRHMIAQLTIPE